MFDIENNSDSCDQILYCCDQKQYQEDFNPSNVLIQIDDSKFSQQNGCEFNKQKEIEVLYGNCFQYANEDSEEEYFKDAYMSLANTKPFADLKHLSTSRFTDDISNFYRYPFLCETKIIKDEENFNDNRDYISNHANNGDVILEHNSGNIHQQEKIQESNQILDQNRDNDIPMINYTEVINNLKISKEKPTIRSDVIYKTIFRTVKKYYGGLFKDSTDFFKIKKKSARKKIAYEYSLHFVKTYFLEKDDLHIFSGVKDQDLANYFGRMIIPEYIGKCVGGYQCRKETDTFFDCIYHYSADVANRLYKSDIPKTLIYIY